MVLIISDLSDRVQPPIKFCSYFATQDSVVPHGSVLGPILFTMFIKLLSTIIDSFSIMPHSFADDLQLQISAPPNNISKLLQSMQSCLSDIKSLANVEMLKLNEACLSPHKEPSISIAHLLLSLLAMLNFHSNSL